MKVDGPLYKGHMPRRRSLLAWLYTGPIGHLVAGVTDWVELLARWAWSRASRRRTSRR
jgi:hypothetical protein